MKCNSSHTYLFDSTLNAYFTFEYNSASIATTAKTVLKTEIEDPAGVFKDENIIKIGIQGQVTEDINLTSSGKLNLCMIKLSLPIRYYK